jgi:hypothetical protein
MSPGGDDRADVSHVSSESLSYQIQASLHADGFSKCMRIPEKSMVVVVVDVVVVPITVVVVVVAGPPVY